MKQTDFGPMLGRIARTCTSLGDHYDRGYRASGQERENIAAVMDMQVSKLIRMSSELKHGRKRNAPSTGQPE
tara:strand:+ start:2284 stop:2499 length:216 start_codon:yes stop_codon:yes gene_type:complete